MEGVMPCVHAIGLQEILKYYRTGVTQWIITTADCNCCVRGSQPRLYGRLDLLSRSLKAAGHPGLSRKRVGLTEWLTIHESAGELSSVRRISRRGFLGSLLRAGAGKGEGLLELSPGDSASFFPAGQLLPQPNGNTLWPQVPLIDAELCNGCDACARLCPESAIALVEGADEPAYRLSPQRCTGCGICIDLCEASAVWVEAWKPLSQTDVPLKKEICAACGNPFHRPFVATAEEDRYCRICADRNHYQNLYQVLS
jgi:Pyruvate/2-oxoacid:ferredoxin oxidoreductase delta subunit